MDSGGGGGDASRHGGNPALRLLKDSSLGFLQKHILCFSRISFKNFAIVLKDSSSHSCSGSVLVDEKFSAEIPPGVSTENSCKGFI